MNHTRSDAAADPDTILAGICMRTLEALRGYLQSLREIETLGRQPTQQEYETFLRRARQSVAPTAGKLEELIKRLPDRQTRNRAEAIVTPIRALTKHLATPGGHLPSRYVAAIVTEHELLPILAHQHLQTTGAELRPLHGLEYLDHNPLDTP